MRIQHNSELVKTFADRILGQHYRVHTLGRKGWHRSDAIACPLKCYWRLTGEVKGEFRSKDVGILMLGKMAHNVLEEGFDVQEKIIKISNIAITIDAMYGKEPVEIKSTRRQIYRKEDLPRPWVEQLAIAMSVMGADVGHLMVINIITFALTVWTFTLTHKDRELFLHTFIWQIMSIADSIKKKDPSILTPKYNDCQWCYYRPSRKNKGCPFYKKPPKKPPKKK